ncbi:ABC transporter substrate-binding protein [Variovorax sp. YR216]|uniref:ABC transporter substrate-binding protein n=1 Tax=Variovorax sp. YR216 TaxID=1882828 RepID=UPI0008950D43|nr:ABC transporter substrate-binding protein [Variovorax sp. YR216]SEB25979.1 amino acid/amide ABC transporter substrate-binding protein, HAAT family [Variovorax sp. YR216]
MFSRLIRAAALAAAGLAAAGAHAQGEPIRIGAVLSATGPVGFIGDPQQKTLELHVKQLNEQGGVLGRKIALTVYDDQSDPNNANTFAKRLIESDKVDVLLGGTVSPPALAMVPYAERAGVPFVSTGGSLSLVDPVKKWVFKTPHSDRMVAERILQDMKERGIQRIAMLTETSGFGQSGKKEVNAAAGKFGITVVGEETYGAKDTDITPQLTRLRNLKDTQAMLIFCGAGTSPAVAIKNYAQMGMKLPVYMPHAAVNREFIKLGGPATEGVRMPTTGFVVPDALPGSDPQKKPSLDYYRTYKEAYKADASPFGGNIADALAIAVDAIQRAGGTDRAKVRDAIEATKGLVGLNGIFTMSSSDHNGLKPESLRIVEVRNGRFELVK